MQWNIHIIEDELFSNTLNAKFAVEYRGCIFHDFFFEEGRLIKKKNVFIFFFLSGPSGVKFLSRKYIYEIVESAQEPNFYKMLSHMEETVISKFCTDEDQRKDWKQKLQ